MTDEKNVTTDSREELTLEDLDNVAGGAGLGGNILPGTEPMPSARGNIAPGDERMPSKKSGGDFVMPPPETA